MPSSRFLSAHIISELRALAGRAKVTFPYKESGTPEKERLARVERVQKVSRGTADNIKWLLDFETPDEEWSNAKLVDQIKLTEDDQHCEVYRKWEELTGLPLRTIELWRGGAYKETVKQRVPAGTIPSNATGFVLSDTVTEQDALIAERETVRLVDADGNAISGDTVLTSERIDEETGVPICTDHFLSASTYTLPPTYVGGTPAQIAAHYPDWPQPAEDRIGYSDLSYSPPRYVIDARKQSVGDASEKFLVEIDYCRIPDPHVIDAPMGYRFPDQFWVNPDFVLASDFTGTIRPPFNIGAGQPNGYTFIPGPTGTFQARTYKVYRLGRREDLPPEFRVVSPGNASRVFGSIITEKCIHGPILINQDADGVTLVAEDIPSSTPSIYNTHSILVARAREGVWKGEIHCREVTYISQDTPISAFPDPVIYGYGTAERFFSATPAVRLTAPLQGRQIVAVTSAGSVSLTLYGRSTQADGPTDSIEVLPATTSAAASVNTWLRVNEVLLDAPLATGTVTLTEPADPDSASLLFTDFPADGDQLVIGLSGSETIYSYRTDISSAGIVSATVTAPGTGFTNPNTVTVTFGGATGSGATGTVQLVGTSIDSLTVDSGGAGYLAPPTVSITGGGGTGAVFTANLSGTSISSYTKVSGGAGYTGPPLITVTPVSGGSGAVAFAVFTATGVAGITMTSFGAGYTAPTATISGGGGTGATATATLETHLIKIASTLANQARNTVKAIQGAGADIYASAVAANPDVSASLDPGNPKLVNFAGTDPLNVGGTYTFGIFESDGTTPETFADGVSAGFTDGTQGEILCIIPAGTAYAYNTASFSSNACLTDETNDNDRKAAPTLPAAVDFYTDWMQIPAGKEITLKYAAFGSPALRVAWQKSATAAEPATSSISVGVTHNSTTVSSGLVSGDVGKAILIAGDTLPNEVVNATTLLRPYTGSTATQTADLSTLAATLLPSAGTGQIRERSIGTPGAEFIRLKLTRTGTGQRHYRAIQASATWSITPND